jgi:tripartite-type tricarboxylate transporter receptor subunit TctC
MSVGEWAGVDAMSRKALLRSFVVLNAVFWTLIVPTRVALSAEIFPSKTVRLIVPFSAGGTTDILARLLTEGLSSRLKQPVIVKNRPGANGLIGTQLVAKASPDGYTLLMGYAGTLAVEPNILTDTTFDPAKDFAPITNLASTTQALVARSDFPANDVRGLIELARSRANPITFASAGIGSPSHMSGELFNAMAHVELVHVPYKGSGAVMQDLLGGHVDLSFGGLAASLPLIRSGQLKILGVTSGKRSPVLPDTPAISETLPGYEVLSWFGILAPANTPEAIVDRLHDEVVAIAREPEFKRSLNSRVRI